MTSRKSFKELVRERMEKTGESYSIARMQIAAPDENGPSREGEMVCCKCGRPIDGEDFKYFERHCWDCWNYLSAMGASPEHWDVD